MIIKKPVHYKYMSIKQIRTLAQSFKDFISEGTGKENVRKRGRPPKYSDEYILSLFFMRVIRGLLLRASKLSSVLTHKLSGFRLWSRRYPNEPDRIQGGD